MLGVIQPILDKFLWGINQQFMPQVAERGHILVADYSAFDVVTETEKAMQQMAHDNFKNGRSSWNEYRQAGGLDPLPGGDFFMLPTVGYTPIPANQIGEAPALIQQAQQPMTNPATTGDLYQAVERLSMQQKTLAIPETITVASEQVTRRSPFLDADDPMSDDLRKWQSVTLKRWKSGQLEQALAFESAMIPPLLNAAIKGALQSCTSVDQIYTVFDDADRYRLHDAGTH
jgi:hypothetical protein